MKKLILGLILSFGIAIPVLAIVDLNTATQAELEAVKGIGPGKAKSILAHREKYGPFKSIDELAKVKGFGKASVAKLRTEFSIGEAKSETAAKPSKP